jgi:phosphate transport system substrate-binding protein
MKRFRTFTIAAFAAMLVIVPAASAETLIGSGSVAMQPYIVALQAKYKKLHPGLDFAYNANGGNAGIKDVQSGKSQFAGQARAPIPSDGGTTYLEGFKDGMAIIVNKKNKLTGLKLQQVSDIYTGKITSWTKFPASKLSSTIQPYGRESNAGQYTYFLAAVLNGANQATNVTTELSDGLVYNDVKKNKSGIGYVGQAWLKPAIKALKLNKVAISTKTVKSNKYVLSRYLYWVVPETNVNPEVAKFIDWTRKSYAARKIIEKIGGVAIFNAKKASAARAAANKQFASNVLGN